MQAVGLGPWAVVQHVGCAELGAVCCRLTVWAVS